MIYHINKMKGKNHMIISTHAENWQNLTFIYDKTYHQGQSQDVRGIGHGDHFLPPEKIIKRSFEYWVTSTKQILNAGRGHQARRKAAHSLLKEVGKNINGKKTKDSGMETCTGEGVVNMYLTSTPRGEVAQMLATATSEWELVREVQAASSILRVRAGSEWPEDNLREVTWASNPNCGIDREREERRRRKRTFPWKALTHSLAHSQNKGLSECQKRASWLSVGPSPVGDREADMWQTQLEGKGLLQSWPQGWHLPPNCEQVPSF